MVLAGVLAGDTANVVLSDQRVRGELYERHCEQRSGGDGERTESGGSASGNYTLEPADEPDGEYHGLGVTISSGLSANNKVYDGTTAATLTSNTWCWPGCWLGIRGM